MAGLADSQLCPECGKASFEPVPFHDVPDNFLRTLRTGARIVTLAYASIGIALILLMSADFVFYPLGDWMLQGDHPFLNDPIRFELLLYWLPDYSGLSGMILMAAGVTLLPIGWWILTKIPESTSSLEPLLKSKITLRVASCSLVPLVAGLMLGVGRMALLFCATACVVLLVLKSSAYLRMTAARTNRTKLIKRSNRCTLSNRILCVTLMLAWFIMPTTYLIESNSYEYNSLRTLVLLSMIAVGLASLFLNTAATSTLSATLKVARKHPADTHSK